LFLMVFQKARMVKPVSPLFNSIFNLPMYFCNQEGLKRKKPSGFTVRKSLRIREAPKPINPITFYPKKQKARVSQKARVPPPLALQSSTPLHIKKEAESIALTIPGPPIHTFKKQPGRLQQQNLVCSRPNFSYCYVHS
jgi:hypothetical protein